MHILISYRGVPHARGRETGACLARAFRQLGYSIYEYGNYYGSTERLSNDKPPSAVDLLVYCECNDSDPQYTELKNLDAGCKVYWDFDVHTHPARTLLFALRMRFDHIFFANKLYEGSFRKINSQTHFLPYAFDDEYLRPIPNIQKTVGVGLCGSPYPTRVALIEQLRQSGIDARLFSGVYGEDMVHLINSFKIHLNYNPEWGRGILNSRVWETIGCGTLLLTQSEDFIELFFCDHEHLSLYQDTGDCIRLARYWLDHPDEREQIAQAGHEYGLEHHTYVARARTMLDTVKESHDTGEVNLTAALFEIARNKFRGGIRN